MNVAISRAKALLIIIGNGSLFGTVDKHWRYLLEYCKQNNLFANGVIPTWTDGSTSSTTNNNAQQQHPTTINNNNNNTNIIFEFGEEFVNIDQAWREDY